VEEFGVGLLDIREEYHKKLVQSLDQTLKDKGRIGNLIGGLVRWHHEHGIDAGSWMSMAPVARTLTTAWEAGPRNRRGSKTEARRTARLEGEEGRQRMGVGDATDLGGG